MRLCRALRCKRCLELQTGKGCDEAEGRLCKRRVEFRTTLRGRLPHRRATLNDSRRRRSLCSALRAHPRNSHRSDSRSETFPSLTVENNSPRKMGRHFGPHVQKLSRWLLLRSSLRCAGVVGHRPEILRVH